MPAFDYSLSLASWRFRYPELHEAFKKLLQERNIHRLSDDKLIEAILSEELRVDAALTQATRDECVTSGIYYSKLIEAFQSEAEQVEAVSGKAESKGDKASERQRPESIEVFQNEAEQVKAVLNKAEPKEDVASGTQHFESIAQLQRKKSLIMGLWFSFLTAASRDLLSNPKEDFLNHPEKRAYFIAYGDKGRAYLQTVCIPREHPSLDARINFAWQYYSEHSPVMQHLYEGRTLIIDVAEDFYRWLSGFSKDMRAILGGPMGCSFPSAAERVTLGLITGNEWLAQKVFGGQWPELIELGLDINQLTSTKLIDVLRTQEVPDEVWQFLLTEQEHDASTNPKNDFLNHPDKRQYFRAYGENGRAHMQAMIAPNEHPNPVSHLAWQLYGHYSPVMQQFFAGKMTAEQVKADFDQWLDGLCEDIREALTDPNWKQWLTQWLQSGALSWSEMAVLNWQDMKMLAEHESWLQPLIQKKQLTVTELQALVPKTKQAMLSSEELKDCLETGQLTVANVLALTLDEQQQLCDGYWIAFWLATSKLKMADLLALDPCARSLLFKNPNILASDFNFQEPVTLAQLSLFFRNYYAKAISMQRLDDVDLISICRWVISSESDSKTPTEMRQGAHVVQLAIEILTDCLATSSRLTEVDQLAIHRILWNWYTQSTASDDRDGANNRGRAFYHGNQLVQMMAKLQDSSQASLREQETLHHQLMLNCVERDERIDALYHLLMASQLAMVQVPARIEAFKHYQKSHKWLMTRSQTSAAMALVNISLTASLCPTLLGFDELLSQLAALNQLQIPNQQQYYARRLRQFERKCHEYQMTLQGWVAAIVATPQLGMVYSVEHYAESLSLNFKKDLLGAIKALSPQLQWRALWQIVSKTSVLHALLLSEAADGSMDEHFFMRELQKMTMNKGFEVGKWDDVCLAALQQQPDVLMDIQQNFSFLYNVLPASIKNEHALAIDDSVISPTQSPFSERSRRASSATTIMPLYASPKDSGRSSAVSFASSDLSLITTPEASAPRHKLIVAKASQNPLGKTPVSPVKPLHRASSASGFTALQPGKAIVLTNAFHNIPPESGKASKLS